MNNEDREGYKEGVKLGMKAGVYFLHALPWIMVATAVCGYIGSKVQAPIIGALIGAGIGLCGYLVYATSKKSEREKIDRRTMWFYNKAKENDRTLR